MKQIEVMWDKLRKKRKKDTFNEMISIKKSVMRSEGMTNKHRYNSTESRLSTLRMLERNLFRSEMKLICKLMGGSTRDDFYGRQKKTKIYRKGESCFQDKSQKPQLKLIVSND